jgi:hypothetical protein
MKTVAALEILLAVPEQYQAATPLQLSYLKNIVEERASEPFDSLTTHDTVEI